MEERAHKRAQRARRRAEDAEAARRAEAAALTAEQRAAAEAGAAAASQRQRGARERRRRQTHADPVLSPVAATGDTPESQRRRREHDTDTIHRLLATVDRQHAHLADITRQLVGTFGSARAHTRAHTTTHKPHKNSQPVCV